MLRCRGTRGNVSSLARGVKKDGVYKTSDFAASFESLPPGPDYHDVALDVHSYLPRLNKKGTLFRPSVAVIQQRGREFESMIMALWQEDCPTLFKELRELSQIRDFFGYWQRDDDRLRKSGISVAGGNLYGTAAASTSAVSLVPTLALCEDDGLFGHVPAYAWTRGTYRATAYHHR